MSRGKLQAGGSRKGKGKMRGEDPKPRQTLLHRATRPNLCGGCTTGGTVWRRHHFFPARAGWEHSLGRARRVSAPWTCAHAPPPAETAARSTAAGQGAGGLRACVDHTWCPSPHRLLPAHLQREAGLPLAIAVVRVAHGGHQAVHHAQVQHLLCEARVGTCQDPGPWVGDLGCGDYWGLSGASPSPPGSIGCIYPLPAARLPDGLGGRSLLQEHRQVGSMLENRGVWQRGGREAGVPLRTGCPPP